MITCSAWRGKRYAVLGLARSGAASVHALIASGAEVVAWDADEAKHTAILSGLARGGGPSACKGDGGEAGDMPLHRPADGPPPRDKLGEDLVFADPHTLDLTGFTAVVVSPGVPLNRHPIAAHAAKHGVPVIGDIELFAQARAELPPHKVIGITGTNGKSTTTALIHHILTTAGLPTTMGGNIGLPILGQAPLAPNDAGVGVYVLELSSFQIDLTFTLDCDVAVLLNVTPDHLDRYDGFDAYAAAKLRLFGMQSASRHGVIATADPLFDHLIADALDGPVTWDVNDTPDPAIDRLEGPALQGPHNRQNIWAADRALHAIGIADEHIRAGIASYPGLPHRMERIREANGVLFVNDSKATNPESAAPALAAYPAVRWICGGKAKAATLDACAPHFGHVRHAYTIGEAAPLFADILRPHMAVEESGTLGAAVAAAARDARPGETVLLSPACASFDQFRDFEARGDAFRTLVEALGDSTA